MIEPATKDARAVSSFRYRLTAAIAMIILVILLGRSFHLQVVKGSGFREQAEGNRIISRHVPPPRGLVFDRNGKLLVENIASTDIFINPATVPSEEHESVLLELLPELAPVEPAAIRDALETARRTLRPTRLHSALGHEAVVTLQARLSELAGVELESSLVRKYHGGQEIAPFMGYASSVSSDELTSAEYLHVTDISGKAGVERSYDKLLHGTAGTTLVEIDADGTPQQELEQKRATAGANLHLTIDAELQRYIYELLREREAEKEESIAASVVALDPTNGEVRALVSYPSYDPNIFSQPGFSAEVEKVINDERQLLFNRAVDGTYPPGSTIKPLLALAALEENIISSHTTVASIGGISVGPWHFPDWKEGGHGTTDVKKALAESVNTFFYAVTGGYKNQSGLGVDTATEYLTEYGWGSKTDIDLPSEAAGFLPSQSWKQEAKGEPWYIGDTYHLGIGQGDVLVTPLQVATASALFANGGVHVQPHLVATYGVEGEPPEMPAINSRKAEATPRHISTVRSGMRQAVTEGSARGLSQLAIPLAGKTGTAQYTTDDTHAWFTSFGPYENPELVITVLLERGGAGDKDAVPVARSIWEWWIENRLGG